MTVEDFLLAFLLASLFLLLLIGFANRYRVNSIIKRNHGQLWKDLGEPGLFPLGRTVKRSAEFYRKREYLKTNDDELIKACRIGRIRALLFWAVFVALIVTLLGR